MVMAAEAAVLVPSKITAVLLKMAALPALLRSRKNAVPPELLTMMALPAVLALVKYRSPRLVRWALPPWTRMPAPVKVSSDVF